MSEIRWDWGALALHGLFFAVPTVVAWTSRLDDTAYLPLVALPASLAVGLVLLLVPRWRAAGAWVAGATVLAALLEVGLAVTLVIAYSEAHPDWQLS